MPVAAPSQPTGVGAHITVEFITVVAGFKASFARGCINPVVAITTSRSHAADKASIPLVVVAIIACFITLGTRLEVETLMPIATSSRLTVGETGVVVSPVAIVAGFTRIEDSVTTFLSQAGRRTTVAIVLVAIIALFIAWRTKG